MWKLLCVLVLAGCSSLPYQRVKDRTIPVTVTSQSWNATRVRIYCWGEKMPRKTVRDINMAGAVEDTLKLDTCTWWQAVVEDIGGARHASEMFHLSRDDHLLIEIGVHSQFLNVWTQAR